MVVQFVCCEITKWGWWCSVESWNYDERWLLYVCDIWVKTEFMWIRLGLPGVLQERGITG